MLASGHTMTQIADKFKVEVSTISRDIEHLRKQARERQQVYIDEELPFQHRLAVASLDRVIEEAWRIFGSENGPKARLVALTVVSDAIMKKQSVLGDPSQIQRAIGAVSRLRGRIENNTARSINEKVNALIIGKKKGGPSQA